MASSKEILSGWSRKMNIGPVDFPTEFRLITAAPGLAPQYAQLGRSSSHFRMADIPRQGLHPPIEWVPNFQKIAVITEQLNQQSSHHMTEHESFYNGATNDGGASGELYSKSLMSMSTPDSRWNQLVSVAPPPANPAPAFFKIGERVLARYHGGAEWWKARIDKINQHDSGAIWFDVIYDSRSERERGLPSYFLKPDPDASAFKKGDKVKVRYRGRASWHLAEIVRLSPSQPWLNGGSSNTEKSIPDDAATVFSGDSRTMPGVGTDKCQLAHDYLLYDDHRTHHLSLGQGMDIIDETSLPEGYDPDLLVYDVRYPGGKIESSVPKHLIRREVEKKKPAPNPLMGTSVHEELGFLLRQRTNTARLESLKKKGPQEEEEGAEVLSVGTATIREATKDAAQNATDLRHQLIPDAEAATEHRNEQQEPSVISGARSTGTVFDSFEISEAKDGDWSIARSRPTESDFDYSVDNSEFKGTRFTVSSRLRSTVDDMEGYADDTGYLYQRDGLARLSQSKPSAPLELSGNSALMTRTLVVDHTPPRLTLQQRMAQQGHDRKVLRTIGARQADPDGVTVPTHFVSTVIPTKPIPNSKKLVNKARAKSVVEDDEMSLAGWSGGSGFGQTSVGSSNRRGPVSPKPKKSHLQDRKRMSRRSQTQSAISSVKISSRRRSELVSRGEVLGRASAPSSLFVATNTEFTDEGPPPALSLSESFTIKDPMSSRPSAPTSPPR